MSSMYAVGTYEKNKNGIYEINKPIILTGIDGSFVSDLLKYSGIDVHENFYFCYMAAFFYKIDKEWKGPFNERYKECFQQDIYMDEIPDKNYPLICDMKERNGERYGITEENIKETNYNGFNLLNLNMENIRNFLKNNSYFANNHDDWLLKDIIELYTEITNWIKLNKQIYWYNFY